MELKIKKQNSDGIVRLETSGLIKEVMVNEDFTKETIDVCFKGKNSSGIITLSMTEIEDLCRLAKKQTHLVKGFKEFKVMKGKSPI